MQSHNIQPTTGQTRARVCTKQFIESASHISPRQREREYLGRRRVLLGLFSCVYHRVFAAFVSHETYKCEYVAFVFCMQLSFMLCVSCLSCYGDCIHIPAFMTTRATSDDVLSGLFEWMDGWMDEDMAF